MWPGERRHWGRRVCVTSLGNKVAKPTSPRLQDALTRCRGRGSVQGWGVRCRVGGSGARLGDQGRVGGQCTVGGSGAVSGGQVHGWGIQCRVRGVSAGSGGQVHGGGGGAYERTRCREACTRKAWKEGLRQILSTHVHSSSIHNCRKMEITHVSINRRMGTQIMV